MNVTNPYSNFLQMGKNIREEIIEHLARYFNVTE